MKYIFILIGIIAAEVGLVWLQQHVTIKLVDKLAEVKGMKEPE
nr:MAG TPA: hypothetical protein [Caudoviricetes sp.]